MQLRMGNLGDMLDKESTPVTKTLEEGLKEVGEGMLRTLFDFTGKQATGVLLAVEPTTGKHVALLQLQGKWITPGVVKLYKGGKWEAAGQERHAALNTYLTSDIAQVHASLVEAGRWVPRFIFHSLKLVEGEALYTTSYHLTSQDDLSLAFDKWVRSWFIEDLNNLPAGHGAYATFKA